MNAYFTIITALALFACNKELPKSPPSPRVDRISRPDLYKDPVPVVAAPTESPACVLYMQVAAEFADRYPEPQRSALKTSIKDHRSGDLAPSECRERTEALCSFARRSGFPDPSGCFQ